MGRFCALSLLSVTVLLLVGIINCNPNPKPLFGVGFGRKQSAGAEGTLTCGGEPEVGVKVKLYDDDRGVDTDDFMGETITDSKGHFRVEGFTHEFTSIDPKINIYHDCHDGGKPCQRKVSIMIPDKYIASGTHPETYYDAGTIELEGKFSGETRDCIH
ncbi:hypothetical protein GPALN_001951 [Globodera pallida]|nr:hypothetical protein GPALN_001951 [Globodera pallida]